jgi:hypothetical protein
MKFLIISRGENMEEAIFNEIKNFLLEGRPLHNCASWAIWDISNPDNTEIIENSIKKLNPNIVIMGLNFAGPKLIIDDPVWNPWKNFHFGDSRMDKRLRLALTDTKLEGAYMSDIIKYIPTRTAKELIDMIRQGRIDMGKQVKNFIDEINILKANNIELYLMGNDSEWLFNEYVKTNTKYNEIKNKIKLIKNIGSPSPANALWEENVSPLLNKYYDRKNKLWISSNGT